MLTYALPMVDDMDHLVDDMDHPIAFRRPSFPDMLYFRTNTMVYGALAGKIGTFRLQLGSI